MASTVMKAEIEAETCSVCGGGGDLFTPEEHDAGSPPMQVPLRTMLLHINNNKVLPEGKLCVSCIRRALEAYEFSTALSSRTAPPLGEKIRALRCKLHELTQKIDVFIVVGGPSPNSGGVYSQDDIIMVDKDALAAAAAADEDLEKARNACGDNVYQCSICPQSFQRVSEYREHVSSHPAGARHSCWTCGAQFTGSDALKDHAVLHAVSLPGLVCNLCNVTFQSSADMRRHESVCGATCPACEMRCGSRGALSAHARRSHARTPPLLCAHCFLVLPSAELFAAHALSHRQAERFVCGYDACILRFANRSDLLAHIRKYHAGEEVPEPPAPPDPAPPAPVACENCGRTFGSVAAMKRHARVHRREVAQEADWEGGEIEKALSRMHGMEPLEGDVEYLEMEALEDM